MRNPRNQLTIAVVAGILGLLVVVQLRSQAAATGLETLSAQELTVLVANLNTRNDQLRLEIGTTERELADLESARARGETSVGQLRTDLARIRAWTGLDAVSGAGIRVTVAGPITGSAVQDLLNELRNSGAEALSVDGARVVQGTVVSGQPSTLSIEGAPLHDPFDVSAIGNSATLTGSLTRAGGLIAQLAATDPSVQLSVVPLDILTIPATERDLVPVHASPKL